MSQIKVLYQASILCQFNIEVLKNPKDAVDGLDYTDEDAVIAIEKKLKKAGINLFDIEDLETLDVIGEDDEN